MKIIGILIFVGFTANALVQSPANCMSRENGDCYFGTVKEKSKAQIKDDEFTLGKETVLKKNQDIIYFIDGELLMKINDHFSLRMAQSSLEMTRGEYILNKFKDVYKIRTLEGRAQVMMKEQTIDVTEGFEISLAPNSNGGYDFSTLKIIPLEDHLVQYGRLSSFSRSEFIKYVQAFKTKYKNYQIWAQELHEGLIERHLAQEKAENDQRAALKARQKLEIQKLKQTFHRRVFER